MRIDFGKTAAEHMRHRADFPPALLDRLAEKGIGLAGQALLDVGTGTGTLARAFARRGAVVTGLDRSEPLIQAARRLDAEAGTTVTYVLGTAEETGLPDGAFDAATAGQSWQWFHRARAAAEIRRVLVPGGRLAICHHDWIPLPGNAVAAAEALILKHNPTWHMAGGTGLYPAWLADVAGAGFREIETFSFDVAERLPPETWRARLRASAGIAAALPPEKVAAFDDELERTIGPDPLEIPHRCWALTAVSP
jgi:SAM-dependent methyltransferase